MTALIQTHEGKLITVNSDIDILFARDVSSPYLAYYYNEQGGFYATKTGSDGQVHIVKQSISDLTKFISGAEVVNEEITETVIEMLS